MLHLRWITDVHNIGESAPNLRTGEVEDRREERAAIQNALESFVKQSRDMRPEMVINTGDNIQTAVKIDTDGVLHREFQDIWSPIKDLSVSTPGNHDVACFTPKQLCAQFGFCAEPVVHRTREATIIVWNAAARPYYVNKKIYYKASDDDLAALDMALLAAHASKPVLLFTHIPLYALSKENPMDAVEAANPKKSFYSNGNSVFDLIEKRKLDVRAFAGHRHYHDVFQYKGVTIHTMDRFVRKAHFPPQRLMGTNFADIIIDGGDVNINFQRGSDYFGTSNAAATLRPSAISTL